MEVEFSWIDVAGSLVPFCHSNRLNDFGVSPLACLLMDSGGQRHLSTIPWIDEGLARIKSVRMHEVECADWDREDWFAEMNHHSAKIYSAHDETCSELVGIDGFEEALSRWKAFLLSKPALRSERYVLSGR
jgi:hypothetical protein